MNTRPWRVAICVLVVCALAVGITLVVRSRSLSHRANAAMDELRAMPGVTSADAPGYPESGDDPRNATVRMSPKADAGQVAKVIDRAQSVAGGEVIGAIRLQVGTAGMSVGGTNSQLVKLAPAAVALARMPHGTANLVPRTSGEFDIARITVDPDGQQPMSTARSVLAALLAHGAADNWIDIGTQTDARVVMVRPGRGTQRVLSALAPYDQRLGWAMFAEKDVHLRANPGLSTVELHRAVAPVVNRSLPGKSLTVEGAADDVQVSGIDDAAGVPRMIAQLRSSGIRLTRYDTSRCGLTVLARPGGSSAADLPRIQRALAALHPALAPKCTVSVVDAPRGYRYIFYGSFADLTRLAPTIAAATAQGYDVRWDGAHEVSVALPKGTPLNAKTAKPAMQLARTLPWKGTIWVRIAAPEGIHHEVRFRSTATGTVSETAGSTREFNTFRHVWNTTAGATS